jgi:preprotein translocase subunit SecE
VARNRKRRNDRRPRRPADDASVRPGVATARGQRPEPAPSADETPDPLEHATPDVELAEAQLAIGRAQADAPGPVDAEPGDAELLDDVGGEDEVAAGGEDEVAAGTELSSRPQTAPAPRGPGRLIHFLQGSWRELQRVQWPDRRQVMQATGVVIGFVIVAGVFLGVADWAAQKIVNFILK